jgi:hypothetical protein
VVASGALWGINALSSGEFNYQGGDRRTFYGTFPLDGSGAGWDRAGNIAATNDSDASNVFEPSRFVSRFGRNVEYFFVGRHAGFVPYFFPGFVALCLWLGSKERTRAWRALAFLGVAAATAGLLVLAPDSWNGGGGPPGNRYFLSLYPVLFFLTPPLASMAAPMIAWIGGALFTAHMVINPFVAAKFTYLMYERGAARFLPVELSMANDLPVMLAGPARARIPYGHDPTMLLYFLDQNAFPPEPPGMWVSGGRRADVVLRTDDPIDHLAVSADSPIRTVLTVSIGADAFSVTLTPGTVATFDLPARGVRARESYAYLLSARSSEGFVPALLDPRASPRDYRNLGALVRFSAVTIPAHAAKR